MLFEYLDGAPPGEENLAAKAVRIANRVGIAANTGLSSLARLGRQAQFCVSGLSAVHRNPVQVAGLK